MLRPNDLHRARHDPISISAPCCPPRAARYVTAFGRAASLACQAEARVSERRLVGLTRFELVTPRLSSVCSNQLSYRPRYSLQRTVAGSLKTR